MSKETLDVTESPKNQFNNFLLKLLSYAAYYIYIRCDDAKGLNVLDGIIDTLSEISQEKLSDLHKQIFGGAYGQDQKISARDCYAKVSAFLSKTYLTECHVSVIPTSILKETKAAPEAPDTERVSAKL